MVVRYARGDFCISQEVTDSAEKLVTSKFVLVRVRATGFLDKEFNTPF